MQTDYDVVVVGAGPAGSEFARLSAGELNVLVLEENREIGRPVQCSGLVSPRAIQAASVNEWLNTIRGMRIISPDENTLSVRGAEIKGYVLDRAKLDIHLAERAIRSGAVLSLSSTVMSVVSKEGCVEILYRKNGEERCVTAEMVVGADGTASVVGRDLLPGRYAEIISCLQCDAVCGEADAMDEVSLYFGRDVAPGFFAWHIPAGSFSRIGLGISPAMSSATADYFFRKLLGKLGVKRLLNLTAGPIPLSRRGHIAGRRALLVGDAAGQAKPLSGGGIYTGMAAAGVAASVVMEAFRAGDGMETGRLMRYESLWKSGMGKELHRAAIARKIFTQMEDSKLNTLFAVLGGGRLRRVLEQGDIDFPTKLSPLALSADPSLWRFSPQLIRALL
ncbi:MAG: geranylgeranyl reductase family protein [Methanomassiliicoccales archaeon]